MNVLLIASGILLAVALLFFAIVSWKEHEHRAARRALILAVLLPLPYLALGGSGIFVAEDMPLHTVVSAILLILTAGIIVALVLPICNQLEPEKENPQNRFDERDIMFSRMLLQEGSERFDAYYLDKPEKRKLDDSFRKRPGLMRKGALYYDPFTVAAADASFKTVAAFHALLDEEELHDSPIPVNPAKMSEFIKRWASKLGALSSGITELQDYHLYSTIGRGERYGQTVELNHTHAIALTVEMDKTLLDHAPFGPTIMESSQQYLQSGAIAVQLAEYIRHLGYSARAHIDGSYRVICPLVARDAGLGEIGRMGLLMTPELGPRVRIAVVTTNMPLIDDQRDRDLTMIDFCKRCKKCADVCPSKAISFKDQQQIGEAIRWQINSEACFTYWCTVGTDCAQCMRACPFSHPDNLIHNMVRRGLKQSRLFREAALKMDDFFYGREPTPQPVPEWLDPSAG